MGRSGTQAPEKTGCHQLQGPSFLTFTKELLELLPGMLRQAFNTHTHTHERHFFSNYKFP